MGTQTSRSVYVFYIAAVWGLALLAGCGGPKALPKDWPVPQLTLPPRSTIMQVISHPSPRGALVASSTWTVIFQCALRPPQVIEDVEGKLRPLRYMRAAERLWPTENARLYLALDKRTQVLLDTKPPRPTFGKYVLTITVNSQVTDISHDATAF